MIKLILTDVDGVLTDGFIHIGQEGELFKSFNVKDGTIVKQAQERGIVVGIITGRKSEITIRRAEELSILEVHQGVEDKLLIAKKLCLKYGVALRNVAFIGDDLPDIELLKSVGFSGSPADAVDEVKNIVSFVSSFDSGKGAFRQFVEEIMSFELNK